VHLRDTKKESLKNVHRCAILLEKLLERNRTAVQYTIVHRNPQAFQQAVALEQIKSMCERAFGQGTPINSVRELDGGQFNNTYLIELADRDPVILRVAPPPERAVFWHERFLMRRELAMQPLLAPIAPLLPTILMSDFTHQILERDYLFQRLMPGELWWDVEGDLTAEEHNDLWRQFGRLVQAISSVQGEAFGLVHSGPQFPTWSLTLLEWLERTITDANKSSLDTGLLCRLLAIVHDHTSFLDEITCPRLMHGDLWLFNLLIKRNKEGPRIVGVLDADRGSWGDPLADWTFFLLPRRASPQEQALFWQGYGQQIAGPGVLFRAQVYQGLHQGKILSVARRDRNKRALNRAYRGLADVVNALQRI
jgi:aminoglycoside phosphotransferase (APT) family kinase protein